MKEKQIKIKAYINGFVIGVVAEYGYRVEFGFIQKTILLALIIGVIINVTTEDEKHR